MENKEWSNPTPAGLVALAVACFCFFALLTGQVEAGAMPLLGCFLIGGFVIQFTVALVDLKQGNAPGGNTFLFFSAYFMLVSGIEMFFKFYGTGLDTRIDGWAWMVLALVVILWTPAFFKGSPLLFAIILLLDIAVPCIVIADLKIFSPEVTSVFSHTAGWLLLACGVIGIYLSAALLVNAAYGKEIFKNPKPLYKGK